MRICTIVPLAGGLLLSSIVPSLAQSGPAPAGAPPCFNEIMPLRNEAEKRGQAIHRASDKKAPREEICKLFNSFSDAEGKYVSYAEKNATWCGIPAGAVQQMKANHVQTLKIRKQVCSVAAAPRPRGPSLSDALGTTTVPSASTTHTGRGTYDTLTGNPLSR